MLIEVHMIQSFNPSNLNRDDTGNPKDALFGGERRVRISSQAQKRPIRLSPHFQEVTGADGGYRTKALIDWLTRALTERGIDQTSALHWVSSFIGGIEEGETDNTEANKQKKSKRKSKKFAKVEVSNPFLTSVLLYISKDELEMIVEDLYQLAQKGESPNINTVNSVFSNFYNQFAGRTSAPDIALFGRMLADAPELNIDAACQIAHAISTHQATTEFDYFTAVDDLQPQDSSGAGMIGLTPFTSATFYRYARVDWRQLVRNLDGDEALAQRSVEGLLRALVFALPTGKQNTFASHPAPDFLLAVVRPDAQGWSLANAFERPVRAQRGSGYTAPSIEALIRQWRKQENMFRLTAPLAVAALNASDIEIGINMLQTEPDEPVTLAERLPEWIQAVMKPLGSGA